MKRIFYLSFIVLVSCSKEPEIITPPIVSTFFVSITAGEGGTVNIADGEYNEGTILEIVATSNAGYTFTNWSDNSVDSSRTLTILADINLQANFLKEEPKQLFRSFTTELDFALGTLSDEDKYTGLNGALNGTISFIKGDFQHLVVGGTLMFRYPSVPYAHFRKSIGGTTWEFLSSYDIGSGVPRSMKLLNSNMDIVISDFGQELSNADWPGNYVWKCEVSDNDLSFSKISPDNAMYHSMSVGDINGDGVNDIAAASWNAQLENYNFSYSAWNNVAGSFERITNFIEPSTGALQTGTVEIGDINNDGDNEIVVSRYKGYEDPGITNFSVAAYDYNPSSNNYEIIYNPGPIHGFSDNNVGCSEMKVRDIDGDGYNDLLFFLEGPAGSSIDIWKSNGNGEFSFSTNIDLTRNITTSGFLLEDIDYDGDLDIVLNYHSFYTGESDVFVDVDQNNGNGTINLDKLLWFNDGNGTFSPKELGIQFYENEGTGLGFCRPFIIDDKIHYIFMKGRGGFQDKTYIKEVIIDRRLL